MFNVTNDRQENREKEGKNSVTNREKRVSTAIHIEKDGKYSVANRGKEGKCSVTNRKKKASTSL